ncbi:hypothetical protein JB92DRAFT_3246749 [Gautieria morchelliformis]|nr:hypothetical protein JB92DRAFT_3246749 [Gautieria morchelliformis]
MSDAPTYVPWYVATETDPLAHYMAQGPTTHPVNPPPPPPLPGYGPGGIDPGVFSTTGDQPGTSRRGSLHAPPPSSLQPLSYPPHQQSPPHASPPSPPQTHGHPHHHLNHPHSHSHPHPHPHMSPADPHTVQGSMPADTASDDGDDEDRLHPLLPELISMLERMQRRQARRKQKQRARYDDADPGEGPSRHPVSPAPQPAQPTLEAHPHLHAPRPQAAVWHMDPSHPFTFHRAPARPGPAADPACGSAGHMTGGAPATAVHYPTHENARIQLEIPTLTAPVSNPTHARQVPIGRRREDAFSYPYPITRPRRAAVAGSGSGSASGSGSTPAPASAHDALEQWSYGLAPGSGSGPTSATDVVSPFSPSLYGRASASTSAAGSVWPARTSEDATGWLSTSAAVGPSEFSAGSAMDTGADRQTHIPNPHVFRNAYDQAQQPSYGAYGYAYTRPDALSTAAATAPQSDAMQSHVPMDVAMSAYQGPGTGAPPAHESPPAPAASANPTATAHATVTATPTANRNRNSNAGRGLRSDSSRLERPPRAPADLHGAPDTVQERDPGALLDAFYLPAAPVDGATVGAGAHYGRIDMRGAWWASRHRGGAGASGSGSGAGRGRGGRRGRGQGARGGNSTKTM